MSTKAHMPRTLLLVDDEPNIIRALIRIFRRDDYCILTANSAMEGLSLLADNQVSVVISDQRMPQMTGVEFLRKVKELYPKTLRIVLSGYTDLESVTSAINEGAIYKFLTKPWDDELLRKNVREAFEVHEMEQENHRLTHELQHSNNELFRLNQQLEQQVHEKKCEIVHNITMLEISQEILEYLPVAMIGIDKNNMIAASNQLADKLFDRHHDGCLLGLQANEFLPDRLLQELQKTDSTSCQKIKSNADILHMEDGHTLQVWVSAIGDSSQSKGTIVVFTPYKHS